MMNISRLRYACRPLGRFYSTGKRKIIKLEKGLVHIKNALTQKEQEEVAKIAFEKGGFWTTKNGVKVLNSDPHRGRTYGAITSYPKIMTKLCLRILDFAAEEDPEIKAVPPTHILSLYYRSLDKESNNSYISWHQDNGDNNGKKDYPVTSFCIGMPADFNVAYEKPKVTTDSKLSLRERFVKPKNLAHTLYQESGDAVVFGGQSRYIWHSIYRMYPHLVPSFLPFSEGRLNFTFRHTPELIGKEEEFQTVSADELHKQRNSRFYKLDKMK